MATTTNYGWTTPDDTSLVKDGAAAIRTLGSSVDTTTKALNPSTTLGDVEYRSATANTNTRLGIGTTGQVLTVTGGVPVWSTPSSGSLTSIASGSLSTGTLSLTSISGSYKDLRLVVRNLRVSNTCNAQIRYNNYSGSFYSSISILGNGATATTTATNVETSLLANGTTTITAGSGYPMSINMDFLDYTNTTANKMIQITSNYENSNPNTLWRIGGYNPGSSGEPAINRIDLILSTGTFSAGTYILYGVN